MGSVAGDSGTDSSDVRYSWKSFEEEKLELLQQLEKVRLKEVTRISEEIQKKEDITQISALIENSAAETEIIENLKSLQIHTDFCETTRQKKDLVEQLAQVQLSEREQLEAIKREKYHEIDLC